MLLESSTTGQAQSLMFPYCCSLLGTPHAHIPLSIAEILLPSPKHMPYHFHLTARISAAFLDLFHILKQAAIPPALYLLTLP